MQFLILAKVGESCDLRCDYTGTCARICAGDSLCIDGVCTCPQGSYNVNGQCVLYPVPQPSPVNNIYYFNQIKQLI